MEPGNAYPLGFDASIPVVVDPEVFAQEWLLFSPAAPMETVPVRGADLRAVYAPPSIRWRRSPFRSDDGIPRSAIADMESD